MRASYPFMAATLGAALAIGAPVAARATDLFLKFPGVTGESTNERHRGEIELKSFATNAFSNTATIGGGGGGVGRAVCGQIVVTKLIDRASPQLLGLMFSGRHTGGPVTVTFEKSSGEVLLDY